MQTQRKLPSQVLMLAALLPTLLFVGLAFRVPPLWEGIMALAMLLLWAVVFVVSWQTKLDSTHYNRQLILHLYLILLPPLTPLVVASALAKAGILQRLGLDFGSAFLVGEGLSIPIIIPLGRLLRRKQERELQLYITDEEKQVREEFQQAIRNMPTGWGMTPRGAINQGCFLFWLGIILGGGCIAGAWAFAGYLGPHGWDQLKNILYFTLICLMGISCFSLAIFVGLKLWRTGRRWREQAAGTVTIQGTFAGWWIEQGMNNKTLVKIQRKDGSSKMLLVGLEFDEALPEIGEDVQIDYLFGCEAVVDVKPLAAADPLPAADN